MKTYIYTLSDPTTNKIRYVGKTTNPKRRLSQHIQDAKYHKNSRRTINWIKSLISKNIKPIMSIIEECEDNWQEREIYWISFYKKTCDLCNHHSGGLGCLGRKLNSSEKERIRQIGYSQSYFNEEQKKQIWELIKSNVSYIEICKLYPKFAASSYRAIKIGGLWNHITGLSKPKRSNNKGINNHKSRKVICNNTNKTFESARQAWLELYSTEYKYSYFKCMLSGYNANKTTLSYL